MPSVFSALRSASLRNYARVDYAANNNPLVPEISDIASEANIRYRWIVVSSLLVSAWLIWLDPLINRDAIIYLRAAEAYLEGGLAASQQVFGRPLLPVCMALLHQTSGIPLLYSGLLITTIFYVVLCVAFVDIVRVLGGKRSVQLIAAVIILSHPWINHTRASIMRDPIYLALVLLSLREMLLYAQHQTIGRQLRWTVFIVLATLFRFEGLFIALLSPLALLFTREIERRWRHCLQLLVPIVLISGTAAGSVYLYQQAEPDSTRLFPAIGLYFDRLAAFPEAFTELARSSAEPLLAFTSREDAPAAAIAALVTILLLNLCRAITWPWLLVLLWGARAGIGHRFRRDDLTIIFGYIATVALYLCVFTAINRFMLERYAIQAGILLLLFLPFFLSSLWHRGGWRAALVALLLLGTLGDTLHNGERDKLFIVSATRWVADNTAPHASLATNEKYIAHFSQREVDWDTLQRRRFKLEDILSEPATWQDRDLLVVYLRPRQEAFWQQFLASHELDELRSFGGGRKGRAVIVALGAAGPPAAPGID